MPISPNGFAKDKIAYADLTALSLLDQNSYVDYAQIYPDMAGKSYIMAAEAQPGVLKHSPTKKYKSWRKNTKPLNAFRIASNATAAAGSTVTVTVLPADHLGTGGVLSPPAVGLVFEDLSTGIHYEVVAVNKTAAGAHTAELSVATDATIAPALTAAASYLQSMGRPSVQEDSYQQDGEYQAWTSIARDHTAIRVNKKYTDLVSFEHLEIDGRTYRVWDMPTLDQQFWDYQEFRLMFGPEYNNIQAGTGNENNDFKGLIPIIQDEGTTVTPVGGVISNTFFEDVRRAMSANGYGKTFDVLVDTEFEIALQNYFETRIGTNGAVIYGNLQDGDVRLNFDYSGMFKYYGTNFNVKNYAYFDRSLTHGADAGTGVWTGSALFIPNRTQQVQNESVRSFSIRYLSESPVGAVVHTLSDGGLVGKNTNMNAEFAHVAWKSIDVPNPLEFIWSKFTL